MSTVGVINAIYLLGDDLVLRVPRDHPGCIKQARKEAVAAPAARDAGVRTPRLVVFDGTCELLPVPFSIFERVRGETLGLLDLEPGDTPAVWHALGHDLALLHTRVPAPERVRGMTVPPASPDPRALAEQRAADGWFTSLEVRWLMRWLDRLAPAALTPVPYRSLHLDVQATNVMVRDDGHEYAALLDWGCAGSGDMAWDFFGVPLRAAPAMLAGHRSVAPLDADDAAEARILWRHMELSLSVLPRGAAPGMSWGERPLAWLLEVWRFFADTQDERWRALAP